MAVPEKRLYEFDAYRFDPAARTLLRDEQPLTLTPKNLETLQVLIEQRGRVLEKDELLELLWPDSVVEENNLTQNISALRRALGEKPGEQRFIKTIPGRGYRFVAEVREVADGTELIVQESVRVVIEEDSGVERRSDRAKERRMR
ncbi:MAG: winged helix-turn-helix domain-containing protein [Blastocatellia bacterium]